MIYQPLCLKMQSPLVFRRSHSFIGWFQGWLVDLHIVDASVDTPGFLSADGLQILCTTFKCVKYDLWVLEKFEPPVTPALVHVMPRSSRSPRIW